MSYTISYFEDETEKYLGISDLQTVADYLKFQAETRPNDEAVVFVSGDRNRSVVTFKQVYENSTEAAKRFVKLGVNRADYVAIFVRGSPEWVFAFFGAMFAGAIPVSLAFSLEDGSDIITFMNQLKNCTTVVLDPGLCNANWKIFTKLIKSYDAKGNIQSSKILSLKYLICITEPNDCNGVLTFSELMAWKNVREQLPTIAADDVFTVFQTSGSTGLPKLAVYSNKSYVLLANRPLAKMQWVDSDIVYFNDRSFMWLAGFPSTLLTGQTRVTRLETMPLPKDYVSWLFDVVRQERCTHLVTIPLLINIMLHRQDEVKGDWPLHAIIATAQPVSRKTANCIGKLCKVFGTIYGSTEIGIAFYTMVDNVADFTDFYIGKPLEGNGVKIVDDEGATLPVNEIGEILVRTDTLFKEYCNDPEKTRMRLIDDGPDRWYVTGDVGYMNTNGAFFCTGRKSEIIMSSGLKVMPSSIEAILISSPGVVSAVCIPVAHEIMLNVICACVILIPGCDVTEKDLRQHCEAAHTEKPHLVNDVPSYYMFLEKFPKTRTGKIDKIELKRIAEEKYRPK